MSSEATVPARAGVGRPGATTRELIEHAAFELFDRKGFDGTTLDDIARSVGVGRRTLFRYFESKNDIAWGEFDRQLAQFQELLAATPADQPLAEVLHHTIVAFNHVAPEVEQQHRFRMRLILRTPTLRAYSTLRFDEWRRIVAEFVAGRTGLTPTDPLPRVVGHVSLALSIAAYDEWLDDPERRIEECLDRAMSALRSYLGE